MSIKTLFSGLFEFVVWFTLMMTVFAVYMVNTADVQVFRYMAF